MKIQKYLDMFKQIYSLVPTDAVSYYSLTEDGVYFNIENGLKFV